MASYRIACCYCLLPIASFVPALLCSVTNCGAMPKPCSVTIERMRRPAHSHTPTGSSSSSSETSLEESRIRTCRTHSARVNVSGGYLWRDLSYSSPNTRPCHRCTIVQSEYHVGHIISSICRGAHELCTQWQAMPRSTPKHCQACCGWADDSWRLSLSRG
jgi:hypothetical protein